MPDTDIPEQLFRYRPLSGANLAEEEAVDRELDLIKKNFMWIADPATFNDPFDSLLAHDENSASEVERIRGTVFVAAFSTLQPDYPAAVVMWSHYANQHKGICIRYPFTGRFKKHNSPVYPVRYSNIRPDHDGRDARTMRVSAPSVIGASVHPDEIHHSDNVVSIEDMRRKGKAWEYEQEWSYIVTETILYPERRMSESDAKAWTERQLAEYGPHHRHFAQTPPPVHGQLDLPTDGR